MAELLQPGVLSAPLKAKVSANDEYLRTLSLVSLAVVAALYILGAVLRARMVELEKRKAFDPSARAE
jgi:hypothetical protein